MIKPLLKNDLYFLRTGLMVWAAWLTVPLLLLSGLRTKLGWDQMFWNTLGIGLSILFVVQLVGQMMLTAILVQKESPSASGAYWRTRPFPRRGLALSKVLSLAAFVLLPQIAQSALMIWIFPLEGMVVLDGIRAMAFMAGIVFLLGLPSAALTKNSGQALLLFFTIPVGIAVMDHFFLKRIRMPLQQWLQDLNPFPVSTQTILLLLWVVCVMIGFLASYKTDARRLRRRLTFVPAFLMLFLVLDMPPMPKPLPETTIQLPSEAELTVDSFTFSLKTRRPGGGSSTDTSKDMDLWLAGGREAEYGLNAKVEWSGLPEHWGVFVEAVRSYGPDGSDLYSEIIRNHFGRDSRLNKAQKRGLFPGYDPDNRFGDVRGAIGLFSSRELTPGEIQWPAEFKTTFVTKLYSLEKVLLPFEEGARWRLEGRRLVLNQIQHWANEVTLQVNFLGRGGNGLLPQNDWSYELLFALHDPKTGHAAFGRLGSGSATHFHNMFSMGRYELTFSGLNLPAEAMERLELYAIRPVLIGTDVRTLTYEVSEERKD